MVLIEPPPLLESVAGRKYHYPPAFHRLLWLLSKGLNVILIARSTEVVAYGSCGCRDFIPAAGLTFSRCCYSVFKILRDLDRSFFPFHLVADENTLFMRLKIDFLKFQRFYQLHGIYSTDFLAKLTKFHFECTRQICTL